MGNICSTSDYNPSPVTKEPICLSAHDIKEITSESCTNREHGKYSFKTLISSDRTPTDSLTAGIATLPPRRENQPPSAGGNLGLHQHAHAEVYIVLSGEAIVTIDMIEHKVESGAVLFIPGNAEHAVRNLSLTEKFVWYYCFAADSFQHIRYRYKNDQMQYARA